MKGSIIIGAVIIGGALLYALTRGPQGVISYAALPAPVPVSKKPMPSEGITDRTSNVYSIGVDVAFRSDGAYATMPLRGLMRIDPPPAGRKTDWQPLQPSYSEKVLLGNHIIEIQSPFAGRDFINWLVLPDTAILQTSNPLSLFINESKHITAEFT